MKTPTHFVISYIIADRLNWPRHRKWAFTLGSVVPDLPICLVFGGLFLIDLVAGFPGNMHFVTFFQQLYADNTWLITTHNLLHAPLSIALLFLVTLVVRHRYIDNCRIFLLGSALHSFIDIYTHVDDGPLMLWPFDWETRFISPISHWNTENFGEFVTILEILIVMVFCMVMWARKYLRVETSRL